MIIAVNLNGDLLARRFAGEPSAETTLPSRVPGDFLKSMLRDLPAPLREQVTRIAPRLLQKGPSTPGYFDVLANCINIMQDHITRARLAGEPPHVMLVPRLRDIGLMEFNRAKEAIAEGRYCVEQAMPMLQRYCS
jgi:NTE family protein